MQRLSRNFFLAAVFCLPFQILYRVYDASAYASGQFLIYQSFNLYLSDLFFLVALLFGTIAVFRRKQWYWGDPKVAVLLILLLLCAQLSALFAADMTLAFLHVLRLAMYIGVYFLMLNLEFSLFFLVEILVWSLVLQIILVSYQYFMQSSLGLYILGEPHLSLGPGIAKYGQGGVDHIRPYGTFPHPNILGGVLVGTFFLLRYVRSCWPSILRLIFLYGIVLTFSRSAWIGLLAGILGYLFCFRPHNRSHQRMTEIFLLGVGLAVLLPFLWFRWADIFHDPAVLERFRLMQESLTMIWQNPLGVGMHGFTMALPEMSEKMLMPWMTQPVHNLFLLVGAELGVLGAMILLFLFGYLGFRFYQSKGLTESQVFGTLLVALFVLGLADHYWWDIASGAGYFWLFLGMMGRELIQD